MIASCLVILVKSRQRALTTDRIDGNKMRGVSATVHIKNNFISVFLAYRLSVVSESR